MSGSCGSCSVCLRPVVFRAVNKMLLVDLYLWMARILFLRKRCPLCKHNVGAHRSNLGTYRIEQRPVSHVHVSVPYANNQPYPPQPYQYPLNRYY